MSKYKKNLKSKYKRNKVMWIKKSNFKKSKNVIKKYI